MKIKGNFEVHIAQFNPFGLQKYYDQLIKTMVNKRITDFQAPFQSTSKRILDICLSIVFIFIFLPVNYRNIALREF